MATAGYTSKELMEYMGHADLQMVNRYVKLLPQPGEDDAADRLNTYLRRAEADTKERFVLASCHIAWRERSARFISLAARRDLERHRGDQPPPGDDAIGARRLGDHDQPRRAAVRPCRARA